MEVAMWWHACLCHGLMVGAYTCIQMHGINDSVCAMSCNGGPSLAMLALAFTRSRDELAHPICT